MTAPSQSRYPVLPVLTGPTGIGKTAYSLEIAERLNAEIISADSRQVYRELTIGTAKPDAAAMARIPHHLVGELGLGAVYSAGRFARQAIERIRGILGRGRLPLVVGGSTLYLHALQHGLSAAPETDLDVRRQLEAELARDGAIPLFEELCRVDPDTAAQMDATKTARIVRALEVHRSTGIPLSRYHAQAPAPEFSFKTVVLDMERGALYNRINARVDQMLSRGLVEEVRALMQVGFDPSIQALQTIGYREVIGYLEAHYDHLEMTRLIKRNTRRYAKRQLTWFRRYPGFEWCRVPVSGTPLFADVVARLLATNES